MLSSNSNAATEADAIRPFQFRASDEDLADLKRRVAATRWPDKETVSDQSQGVQLDIARQIQAHWANHDWRKLESRMMAYPHFITEIDGLDIHFIHVKSKHKNALPMIVTHGWPGSVIEQLKIIEPLTDPTAHGGTEADAFDLVIPSLPGYGFSGKPTAPGWEPVRIAKAWATLMERLGYTKYVAQGGDWGNAVTENMALQEPPGLLGIHTNMAATLPPEISKALGTGTPPRGTWSRREARLRPAHLFQPARARLCDRDERTPADALRHRRLACRPRRLDAGPRRRQSRPDRPVP